MVLAVDAIRGCDPSDKMCSQLQPKKSKVRLLAINKAANGVLCAVQDGAWPLPLI